MSYSETTLDDLDFSSVPTSELLTLFDGKNEVPLFDMFTIKLGRREHWFPGSQKRIETQKQVGAPWGYIHLKQKETVKDNKEKAAAVMSNDTTRALRVQQLADSFAPILEKFTRTITVQDKTTKKWSEVEEFQTAKADKNATSPIPIDENNKPLGPLNRVETIAALYERMP